MLLSWCLAWTFLWTSAIWLGIGELQLILQIVYSLSTIVSQKSGPWKMISIFSELLDKVEGELFRMFPKPAAVCPAPSTSQASSHRSMQSASPSHFADPDIVNKLFQGQLISEVSSCGQSHITRINFYVYLICFHSRLAHLTAVTWCHMIFIVWI